MSAYLLILALFGIVHFGDSTFDAVRPVRPVIHRERVATTMPVHQVIVP